MKLNLRKITAVIGLLILGAVIGSAVASYFLIRFMQYGSTLSEIVAIRSNVTALSKLQQGNTDEAIDHLEMMLDGHLLYFSAGLSGTKTVQEDIRSALKTARNYRLQHPRKTNHPEIDKAVASVLEVAQTEK